MYKRQSKNCVNAAKVTDHHALLITENAVIGLFKDEKIVYDMILCRMIEAFSADCIKDITSVTAQVDHEVEFGISGSIIRQTGWRALSLKEKNNRQMCIRDRDNHPLRCRRHPASAH